MRHIAQSVTTALAALIFASAAGAQSSSTYTVTIEEGLQPKLSPSGVAALARSLPMARSAADAPGGSDPVVRSVECVNGSEIRSAFSHPSMKSDSPIWIVRMTGRFVDHRTGLGSPSKVSSSAFYIVDDGTGEIIMFGTSGGHAGRSDPFRLKKGR
jgi:hypothetical protein